MLIHDYPSLEKALKTYRGVRWMKVRWPSLSLRYHTAVPSRVIFNEYGLRAEVNIDPHSVAQASHATQTVRVQVGKTCESIAGWCHASAANGWVTFDAEPRWDRFLNLADPTKSRWGKWTLGPMVCLIHLAAGIATPQHEPETVTVKLEARDISNGQAAVSMNNAVIYLTVR